MSDQRLGKGQAGAVNRTDPIDSQNRMEHMLQRESVEEEQTMQIQMSANDWEDLDRT